MDQIKRFKYPLAAIIILIVIALSFLLGSKYALNNLVIRQITPSQAAEAMKNDHFWSSYREDTLIISGTITSLSHSGADTSVNFKTDSTYGAECSFVNFRGKISKGQTIKVLTIASAAERQPASVKLNNCLLE